VDHTRKGRTMKYTDPLFYKPMGEHEIVTPRPGETIDHLYKRLHRLARSYRQFGRAFRVEKRDEGVLWWRVEAGEHTKLAWWYRLPVNQPFVMKPNAVTADLRQAQATARYLRRTGKGRFDVKLVSDELVVTRLAPVA
jgi:hypothetical protein